MKNTVRVSFDVPIDEHTFLKTICVEEHKPFRDLMKEVFHKTVEEIKKDRLQKILSKGLQEAKEGKGRIISQKELDSWIEEIDNE